MRRQALVAAVLGPIFAAVALVSPARAQLEHTTVGVWRVSSHFQNNAFTHCAMSAYQGGATLLLFALGRSGFSAALAEKSWNLKINTRIDGFYRIDGGPQVAIRGIMRNTNLIVFGLGGEMIVFEQFRTASSIHIGVTGSPELQFNFSISNGAPAFDRLFACAAAGVRIARGDGPAPDTRRESPTARPNPPTRAGTPPGTPPATRPASPGKPSDPTENAIGTGFYVSAAGHIVTAEHVVRGCKALRAQSIGDLPLNVSVVAKSDSDDLALLKGDAKRVVVAPMRNGTLRLGEQIVLFGFPLPGALASSGNLTTGNIAALAGLKDDHRMLQVSAPAQPGNSGGPIVDLRGRVVGVLVHSISAIRFARATGTLPQNVNFGVKASVVLSFLEAHGVAVEQGGAEADLAVADVADRARAFTVRIECLQ